MERSSDEKDSSFTRVGVQGVRLKKFEEIVCDCIKEVTPKYLPLPNLPNDQRLRLIASGVQRCPTVAVASVTKDETKLNNYYLINEGVMPALEWPFTILHPAAHVRMPSCYDDDQTSNLGKLSGMKAVRKEWQLRSMIQCLMNMLPIHVLGPDDNDKQERIKIVDFAGGTGHLALPLALLLPKCDVVLVDLKATSLELVHQKAKSSTLPPPTSSSSSSSLISQSNNNNSNVEKKKKRKLKPMGASRDIDVTYHSNILHQCEHVKNLFTYHGDISTYAENHEFDLALSLHCCGEGTDAVLRACGLVKANFIVSPCCVGKLSSRKRNPYVYHATSSNEATISYPQSSKFCQLISNQDKFDSLAKAADYSDFKDMRSSRNATRRAAKALLEFDRIFFMKEQFGYDEVVLTRMSPWEASPKNDILLGWFHRNKKLISGPYDCNILLLEPCVDSNVDIQLAINQLISLPKTNGNKTQEAIVGDGMEWSKEEVDEYTFILEEFKDSSLTVKMFPVGMGKRKRKLIHFLAETKFYFKHWGEGKKAGEKTVVIKKR